MNRNLYDLLFVGENITKAEINKALQKIQAFLIAEIIFYYYLLLSFINAFSSFKTMSYVY